MHCCSSTARAVVTGFFILIAATGAKAQGWKRLSGHVPAPAAQITATGRLAAEKSLRLAIGVPLRDPEGLALFIEDLYDPQSPNYHRYLTPEQFTERFGPTEGDYQKVIDYAAAHGLTIAETHGDRMLLDVTGPVSSIEGAFAVKMNVYQHPTEGRTFFAPDTEPSVESGVPIQDVSGLSDFELPRPKSRRPVPLNRANVSPATTGSGPGGLFMGADLRAIYAPGVTQTGTGQSVGMMEFDGYYPADISKYESMAGLASVPLQKVLLDGFNGLPTTGSDSGNSEVALDIEMVISIAPGLSNVVIYEAGPSGNPNDVLSAMASNTIVKQFGCSWSFGSNPRTTMDTYFQKLISQGQCFCTASGDSGAYPSAIPEPDDDPYVVVVGGTTVTTAGPGGAWLAETTWNAGDGLYMSSGGVSSVYTNPVWQAGISMTASHGSNTRRNVPDVSMVAENIFEVADNGQQEGTGGTSASSQLYAAFVALANQQAAANGKPAVGFINPATYAIGKSVAYHADFADITTGNNTNNIATSFLAVPGYDLCTGWGAPSGGSMLISLVAPDGFQIIPGRPVPAYGPAGGPFNVTSQNLTLTNSGTGPFAWTLGNVPAWANVSQTTGTLTPGGGSTTVSVGLNAAANKLAAGYYTANLWLTNGTSHQAQLRQVTVQVGQNLVQDGGFEVGDFAYWIVSGPHATDNNFADDGTVYGTTVYDGTYFADLGATNTLNFLTQVLPTRAGQTYLLTYEWTSVDLGYGTTPNQFEVKWNATTLTNRLNFGAFNWTSQRFLAQGSGTNTILQFGFRDDPGILGLDDVSVQPVPLPSFQNAARSGTTVQLSWNTVSGLSYQLQYKTNVTSTNWINLGSKVTAEGAVTMATDSTASATQRFYRVALAL